MRGGRVLLPPRYTRPRKSTPGVPGGALGDAVGGSALEAEGAGVAREGGLAAVAAGEVGGGGLRLQPVLLHVGEAQQLLHRLLDRLRGQDARTCAALDAVGAER